MRYYVAYDDVPKVFASAHNRAWMIFDREVCTPQGETLPILLAINRHVAFRARDSLNEQEARR